MMGGYVDDGLFCGRSKNSSRAQRKKVARVPSSVDVSRGHVP